MRQKAPITAEAWAEIDEEARRSLSNYLAARKLIDFSGPLGWDHSAVATGRLGPAEVLQGGAVSARPRLVRPLVEVRTPFTVLREELDAINRGACDADLDAVIEAARKAAQAEDLTIFHGLASAGIVGLTEATPHDEGHDLRRLRQLPDPCRPGHRHDAGGRGGGPVGDRARIALLRRRDAGERGRWVSRCSSTSS